MSCYYENRLHEIEEQLFILQSRQSMLCEQIELLKKERVDILGRIKYEE